MSANVNQLLNTDIRTKTDKDGTKRIYLVTPGLEEPKTCTCGSFNQMKENQLELSLEFKKYCPDIEFRPICKHIQWVHQIQLSIHGYAGNQEEIQK